MKPPSTQGDDASVDNPPEPNADSCPVQSASPPTLPPLTSPSTHPSPPHHSLGAWNTPLTFDEDNTQSFGFSPKNSEGRYSRAFDFARHHFIGPMPVEAFLDRCMNRPTILTKWPQIPVPNGEEDVFAGVPEKALTEKEIYDPLIKSLNRINPEDSDSKSRCPGFTFINTSNRNDRSHGALGAVKPDVCCYANDHLDVVQKDLKGGDLKGKDQTDKDPKGKDRKSKDRKSKDRKGKDQEGKDQKGKDPKGKNDPYQGRTIMGYAAMFIEVKGSSAEDPFNDPPSGMLDVSQWHFVLGTLNVSTTNHKARKTCFGQMIAYATEILARQHRQFLYSILLCGSMARFIRWDRAGAVVTQAFDIHLFPEHLCDFVWLFALMSDGQRGYDLTVELASHDEEKVFRGAIRLHASTQVPAEIKDHKDASKLKTFKDDIVKAHYMPNHVTVIHIPEKNSSVVRKFLVSRPFIYPITAFGKAWRTYWAVDTTVKAGDKHRVVLLKDTWREDPPPSGSLEGDVIKRLRDGVQTTNVPELLLSGDVKQRDAIPTLYSDNTIGYAVMEDAFFQTSQTQEFLGESWVCGAALKLQTPHSTIRRHTHHRLVLSTPGQALTKFRGTRELLDATFDVVQTLEAASKQHRVVHRNLSPRSIILYMDPEKKSSHRQGYLIDWDQSWDNHYLLDSSARYSPELQFLCSTLASGEKMLTYSVEDDLESLLYVILYLAILWLPLDNRDHCASAAIRGMFEDWNIQSGRLVALGKRANKESRVYTDNLKWIDHSLQTFMDTMLNILQPLRSKGNGDHPKSLWTCSNVKEAWKSFLHEHRDKLQATDKEPSLPHLDGFVDSAPRNVTGEPNFPTVSSRGTKRDHRQFVSDGAATSMARHMGVQLSLDASSSDAALLDDETLHDLQASGHDDSEYENTSKRRRVEVETAPGTLVGGEPSHSLPDATLSSSVITSIMDFDGPVIPCVSDSPRRDGGSAPPTLGLSAPEYPYPAPLVAWQVDPYNLPQKGSE